MRRSNAAVGDSYSFHPTFWAIGSRESVDLALHRLARQGTIRRLARGVYDYPQLHSVFGPLTPSAETIAKALAGRDCTHIQPVGAYAANVLGLSEQVPATAVFLTDGSTRTVKIGNVTIQLRKTTARNMAAAEQRLYFEQVAVRRSLSPVVIEKDFWVCWLLGVLFQSEFAARLVFKGGPSLSKVHGLIDRFSEDIDMYLVEPVGFDEILSTLAELERQINQVS